MGTMCTACHVHRVSSSEAYNAMMIPVSTSISIRREESNADYEMDINEQEELKIKKKSDKLYGSEKEDWNTFK